MELKHLLTESIRTIVAETFEVTVPSFDFQTTRKDFEGDITVLIFPLLKHIKGNPVAIGDAIGEKLVQTQPWVSAFNTVKGFLNLTISDTYYTTEFERIAKDPDYGRQPIDASQGSVMVEYSSPNTNKPLHLGHIRNNLLGYSVAEIIKASGRNVHKTQIINDRGIHICKSMVAWQKFGNGETPESSGMKGDALVGKYYVAFDKEYKKQISNLREEGKSKEEAEQEALIFIEAKEMLRDWEAGQPEVIALWKNMNGWVYDGFEKTYTALGVDFDSYYYESSTYLLGKENIEEGLNKGVFYRKEDGSIWCDLTDEGLDEKIVLRSDGTAVYMTQDIGTAIQRVTDHPDISGMIYTVGNEQDYHFKVLFLILKKLGYDWAQHLYHLSYGMVDLPSGKMKSREGTVVDADDLIREMTSTAAAISEELGKLDGYTTEEKQEIYNTIGLGALKYYILKVDPKKRILFDPQESIDFQGNTGPFIQYTYARIQSIVRKGAEVTAELQSPEKLDPKEKEIIRVLLEFPETIQTAAQQYSPALVANYLYDVVKAYNSFFQNVSIFGVADISLQKFRVELSRTTGNVIATACSLLGMKVPERM